MAIKRQQNWLGQQRVDVADLRALESGVSNDFDVLGGKLMSGRVPLVVRGFTISTTNASGNSADQLQLSVAGGLLMHFGATESGTLMSVDDNATAETLNAVNAKVEGSFTASSTNYIGLDLRRSEDATTTDLKQFLDANTIQEVPKSVPTARTLQYRILISTQPFSVSTNICPIAKVVTNASNIVTQVTDARPMLFRLGGGSDNPNALSSYTWRDTDRRENAITYNPPTSAVDPFVGGDKDILSLKEWMDAMMTTLWEAKSGEFWYSATARDNVKMLFGTPVIPATGDNFQWNGGTNTLTWQSLKVAFENSTGYHNVIQDGSAVMASDGMCLYVDLQRQTNGATIVPAVGNLLTLGSPTLPGSRFIIAWRQDALIHIRDKAYEVGRTVPVATELVVGTVKLSRAATTPGAPIVIADTGGTITGANGVHGLRVNAGTGNVQGLIAQSGTTWGFQCIGVHGIGSTTASFGGTGVVGTGGDGTGANGGSGVTGAGGLAGLNSVGGTGGAFAGGTGDGTGVGGPGVQASGGTGGGGGTATGGAGGHFTGGFNNGDGVRAEAVGTGAGVIGLANGATATAGTLGVGVYGKGTATAGTAIKGDGGAGSLSNGGIGVHGVGGVGDDDGFGTLGGTGVRGQGGTGSGDIGGHGVHGSGGTGDAGSDGGSGIYGQGGAKGAGGTNGGSGVRGEGLDGGHGVTGTGGAHGTAAQQSGHGGVFVGGSDIGGGISGAGVIATGGGGSAVGVRGTATGTATGVEGLSSGASLAGAPSSTGGAFSGTNIGVYAAGASTSAKAIQSDGHVWVNSADPASNVGFTDTVTSKNITKVWADITVPTADGACTINDGFNLSGVAVAADTVTITILDDMASANYAVTITVDTTGSVGISDVIWYVSSKAAGTIALKARYWTGATFANLALGSTGGAVAVRLSITAVGAQ